MSHILGKENLGLESLRDLPSDAESGKYEDTEIQAPA